MTMTAAESTGHGERSPSDLDWPFAILGSIALHSLFVAVFTFGALKIPPSEVLVVDLVFEEPEAKPEPETDRGSQEPKAIPEKSQARQQLESAKETPSAPGDPVAKKLEEIKERPKSQAERSPDTPDPVAAKSRAKPQPKTESQELAVSKKPLAKKLEPAKERPKPSADSRPDKPDPIAAKSQTRPRPKTETPKLAASKKPVAKTLDEPAAKSKTPAAAAPAAATNAGKRLKPTTAPRSARTSKGTASSPNDAKRSVHELVPYLDRPVRPSFAAAIRAVRDLESRITGEDVGPTVKRDERYRRAAERAVKRYQKAADQGFVMAQYNLARALAEGRGAARDIEKAAENFRNAALQGNVPAMLRLAEMHLAGFGVPESRIEAQALYYVASSIGSKGAMQAKVLLAAHLDNAQLVEARKRAQILRGKMPNQDLAQQRGRERQLLAFAAEGDLDGILEALEDGVDANAINDKGRTAAIVAAWRGHRQVLRSLIDAGVEVDAADNQGHTALSWAAINGYPAIAKMLLQEEALVDVRDSTGLTPLIRASWNGHEEVVRALIENRADIGAVDDQGFSALRRAEAQNEEQIATWLRAAGAR